MGDNNNQMQILVKWKLPRVKTTRVADVIIYK